MKWEKVQLGEVLIYEQPTKYIVESEDYDDSFSTPVLTAGKTFILGYTDETQGIYNNLPAIIFDDFTTESKFVTFPFKVKSSAMKILTCDPDVADVRYMFYLLKNLKVLTDQHKRYWISKFANIEVPLPPLHIQQQIADTLDKADALRRKDQELLQKYDKLAQSIFYDMFGDPVRNEKGWDVSNLGDLVINCNNKRIPVKEADRARLKKVFPYYGASGIIDYVDNFLFDGMHLLVGEDGANLISRSTPIAFLAEGQFWVNNHAHVMREKDLPLEYIETVINNIDLKPYVSGSAQPKLTREKLDNLPIINPPTSLTQGFVERLKTLRKSLLFVEENMKISDKLFRGAADNYFS